MKKALKVPYERYALNSGQYTVLTKDAFSSEEDLYEILGVPYVGHELDSKQYGVVEAETFSSEVHLYKTLEVPYAGHVLNSGQYGVVIEDAFSSEGRLYIFISKASFEDAIQTGKEEKKHPLKYADKSYRYASLTEAMVALVKLVEGLAET